MIVIKLGGSLLASGYLLPCLDKIEQYYCDKKTVVVPGGGVFADQVRITQQQWQFDNRTAHEMAILAMKQTALLIYALKPRFKLFESAGELTNSTYRHRISIWSPDIDELDIAGIPSDWSITSDSLSAWLAKRLSAKELVLVKSVKIDPAFDIVKLVEQQIVDASFYKYIQHTAFKLTIVNAENFVS